MGTLDPQKVVKSQGEQPAPHCDDAQFKACHYPYLSKLNRGQIMMPGASLLLAEV